MVAARVGITRLARHRELGGEHDALALVAQELAEQALGGAVRVIDGGVDEVAATVDVEIEDAARLRRVCAPAPVLTEGHGAQCQR
jgi:hypothetical protein